MELGNFAHLRFTSVPDGKIHGELEVFARLALTPKPPHGHWANGERAWISLAEAIARSAAFQTRLEVYTTAEKISAYVYARWGIKIGGIDILAYGQAEAEVSPYPITVALSGTYSRLVMNGEVEMAKIRQWIKGNRDGTENH